MKIGSITLPAHGSSKPNEGLLGLPDDLLVSIFSKLNESSRANTARACKSFASAMPKARRVAQLPTLLEIAAPARPDYRKLLAAFRPGGCPEPDDSLYSQYERAAALQSIVGACRSNDFGLQDWSDGMRYDGEFQHGKIHGRGILVWADGTRYDGEFQHGDKCGRGVFVGADGSRYDGEYQYGRRHGCGTLAETDGSLRAVRYENSQLVDTDGSLRAVRYENSQLVDKEPQGKWVQKLSLLTLRIMKAGIGR